ncbi:helix-turn-helix domain-containing protein [Aestuariispira ectoiniformans]|uniref:helix-turn-helix domain-containing protein n=1 Tax=Aestuariispira ectoiniformans TaxID=2775080 RepID=UPI00223C4C02|nr:helix-turn-helix transcriptional regulator [Aestuariispira ectoiniformans]
MATVFDGRQLKRWRRAQDIKQDYLAETLGVTQASVSRWERGQQIPAPHLLRIIQSMMAGNQRRTRLDAALKRLVMRSRDCVHLIEDQSHNLLISSAAREAEWQRPQSDLLGVTLWQFATEEIARAEESLDNLGWWDGQIDCLAFPVQGREGPPLRVAPQHVLWERLRLEDGSHVRLTTSIDERTFANLPPSIRYTF